ENPMLAGEARHAASDWIPFLGIHRNPESIVFWAILANMSGGDNGESHADSERERREVRLRAIDRPGSRRSCCCRQAWAPRRRRHGDRGVSALESAGCVREAAGEIGAGMSGNEAGGS